MRSTEVMFFCSVYLLFFFMIGSLAGVTTFPPPPRWVGFEIWGHSFGYHISFWDMTLILTIIEAVIIASVIAGIKVFGSGLSFDQSFVVTIAVALFVGGLLAWTMTAMLTGVPIYVSAILTWPFIGALVYSIICMAGGRE